MQLYTLRLIAMFALAFFVAPLAAPAQYADRMRKIGVLQQYAENDPEGQRRFAALIRDSRTWDGGKGETWRWRFDTLAGSSIDYPPGRRATPSKC